MSNHSQTSISPLLLQLADPISATKTVTAQEISAAISLIFENAISPVQIACLLYALHSTQLDKRPDVIAACAASMRDAALQPDQKELAEVISKKAMSSGDYHGGLCDIVGTGGDSHNTYNVSTTSSIIASALLLIAKHGNNASTSRSGSADLLLSSSPAPVLDSTNEKTISRIYAASNYAFLYALEWHPGMKHAATIRKELPFQTIFNTLGPLANPLHNSNLIEARIIGVAKREMGPVFVDALRLSGAKKALVVCGDEDLDEISCAGPTHCWLLRPNTSHSRRLSQSSSSSSEASSSPNEPSSQSTSTHDPTWEATLSSLAASDRSSKEYVSFTISPSDFGLPTHALSSVKGGSSPSDNAKIFASILAGEMPDDDPIMTFVLLNTAALLAVSGICDSDESSMGDGDDGKVITERGPGGLRWKEGVRRARWCVKSAKAKQEWDSYVGVTRGLAGLSASVAHSGNTSGNNNNNASDDHVVGK